MTFLKLIVIFIFMNTFSFAYSQTDEERKNQYEQEKLKIEELENNAKYHGDDEIIRKRMNLPPKLPSFDVWLKNQDTHNKTQFNIEEKNTIPTISKEEISQKDEKKQPVVPEKIEKVVIIKNDIKNEEIGFFQKISYQTQAFWSTTVEVFSTAATGILGIIGIMVGALYYIVVTALVLFPITILMYFELTNPTSSTFKKVREFPAEAIGLMALGAVFTFFIPPIGIITLIYSVGFFINDGMGCFINYTKGELTLPAYCKEADSFFSYLNPMILIRPFYRVTINLDEITNASLWSERSIEEDSQGKLKVKVVNKVQISTLHGSFVKKYRSTAKCERLISLLSHSN